MPDLSFPLRTQDWQFDVARGLMTQNNIHIYGAMDNQAGSGITSLSNIRLSDDMMNNIVYPLTSSVFIYSSSSNDSISGPNAQKVMIEYLKPDFTTASEEIDLTGGLALSSNYDYTYINSFYVSQVNQTTPQITNDSYINLLADDMITILATILAGYNNSRLGQYTVPLGKTLYIENLTYSSVSPSIIGIRVNMNPSTGLRSNSFYNFFEIATGSDGFGKQSISMRVPATCTVYITGRKLVNNTPAYGILSGFIE